MEAGARIGVEMRSGAQAGTESEEILETSETSESADSAFLASEDSEEATSAVVCTIDGITYSDEEIRVLYTDDRSLPDQMAQTDFHYAARDDKVYYRQYHKDSFVEGGECADYQPTTGTDKEIVCIDANGKKTVLFSDKGYGDLFLIGDRFFMTEMIAEKGDDMEETYSNIYSVDMWGQNRIDYGAGEIWAVDLDRNILVVRLFSGYAGESAYYVLDGISSEMSLIVWDSTGKLIMYGYSDGWCYFSEYWEQNICKVVARSIEGGQREIVTLKSGQEAEYGYGDHICWMEIDGDWICVVFGAYDYPGGRYFQSGKFITFKTDGADYQAIEANSDDCFICHDTGRPRVYFKDCAEIGFSGKTSVWDLETNTIFSSDFPPELIQEAQRLLYGLPEHCQGQLERGVLCEWNGDVYALLVVSGTIVRVAVQIDSDIVPSIGSVDEVSYDHLYYTDGYLYFEVTYSVRDAEFATRWGDGYRRLQTDMYRRKLDDGTMELLNTY